MLTWKYRNGSRKSSLDIDQLTSIVAKYVYCKVGNVYGKYKFKGL